MHKRNSCKKLFNVVIWKTYEKEKRKLLQNIRNIFCSILFRQLFLAEHTYMVYLLIIFGIIVSKCKIENVCIKYLVFSLMQTHTTNCFYKCKRVYTINVV